MWKKGLDGIDYIPGDSLEAGSAKADPWFISANSFLGCFLLQSGSGGLGIELTTDQVLTYHALSPGVQVPSAESIEHGGT